MPETAAPLLSKLPGDAPLGQLYEGEEGRERGLQRGRGEGEKGKREPWKAREDMSSSHISNLVVTVPFYDLNKRFRVQYLQGKRTGALLLAPASLARCL